VKITQPIRLAVAALALAAGTAMAARAGAGEDCRHGEHGRFGHHAERMEKRIDALGLDAQTRQKVDAILDGARDQRRESWDQMRAARAKMNEMLARPDVTEAELMAQVDADAALHTEAHKARLRTLLAIRELLTPEQWEAFRAHPERGEAKNAS
jgi:Spy/CpxP family protein refolding chaperone